MINDFTSPQLGTIKQITPKNKTIQKIKFIDNVKQRVYIAPAVFMDDKFKNGIYFILRPLLH